MRILLWPSMAVCILAGLIMKTTSAAEPSLWPLQKELAGHRMVDLTHAFAPGIPHWPGFPDEQRRTIYAHEKQPGIKGTGFFAEVFSHVGQWGTHVDPPAHFLKGGRTVDQITLPEMILPLVVIDVHEEVEKNPDYTLTLERIRRWEKAHGAIPTGAFVALRTDWSKRWPDGDAMENKDAQGVAHYPGWSLEALRFLYEEREKPPPLGTRRPTPIRVWPRAKTITRSRPTFCNTITTRSNCSPVSDQVPEAGAIVIAAFPKPKGGSGFPARVFAIVP